MVLVEVLFWVCAGLIFYTHLGYALVLWALRGLRRGREERDAGTGAPAPRVALVIAAHDEEDVIAAKVANALALDYPRERLRVVVASDGSSDGTVGAARAAGADAVLELPRSGKIGAQNAAAKAEGAAAEILAFSDANALWEPDSLRCLVGAFADPAVGYACGQISFSDPGGDNEEGVYWRFEMWVRQLESEAGGVTAGNGGIYAVRGDAYLPLPPAASHDLSFPFELARHGYRSVYVPEARASERMVPTMAGEFARKRRMMVGLWDIVIGERMASPRGYRPLFAFQILSHRLLRYLTPFLHLACLVANVALLGEGTVYVATMAAQAALLAAAALGRVLPLAPFRLARYYVLVTASIAAGLWDRLRRGPGGAWERAEGTR
jgi:cellulose synthase/poly-beta-1,6-N-acetylglucosamine synthase-like glycosyltransferase